MQPQNKYSFLAGRIRGLRPLELQEFPAQRFMGFLEGRLEKMVKTLVTPSLHYGYHKNRSKPVLCSVSGWYLLRDGLRVCPPKRRFIDDTARRLSVGVCPEA
jgi:hypothetical protein